MKIHECQLAKHCECKHRVDGNMAHFNMCGGNSLCDEVKFCDYRFAVIGEYEVDIERANQENPERPEPPTKKTSHRIKVECYIKDCNYTYDYDFVMDEYANKYKKGIYVSHTMQDMCSFLDGNSQTKDAVKDYIKPQGEDKSEKPTIPEGTLCKFWDNNENNFAIGWYSDNEYNEGYPHDCCIDKGLDGVVGTYPNAKPLLPNKSDYLKFAASPDHGIGHIYEYFKSHIQGESE